MFSRRQAVLAVLLAAPALLPLVHSYWAAGRSGQVPTGFIQYDAACYVANAREHFDQGFRPFYGSPYAGYDSPAIYFQPQTLVLGALTQVFEPGIAYAVFGIPALLFGTFAAILFYGELIGFDTVARKLGFVCFFWGGGLMSIGGWLTGLLSHQFTFDSAGTFDMMGGWWMLNFGRNLVYPMEAWYHGLWLLSMLFFVRGRMAASIGVAFVLCLSHPFSGLSLALLLTAATAVEWFLRSGRVTWRAVLCSGLLVAAHVGYYLLFLSRFPEHRSVAGQFKLAWLYPLPTCVLALSLVWLLAARRFNRHAMKDHRNRLFLVWFLVVLALSNHDLVVQPVQPIHFAHGYDWMALFFLGAPALVAGFERLLQLRWRAARYAAVGLVLAVMLCDNAVWLSRFLRPESQGELTLRRDQKDVLDWLAANAAPPSMVVSEDLLISYLTSTYTRVRSWVGHNLNTPYSGNRRVEVEAAFRSRTLRPEWKSMPVLYVQSRATAWTPPAEAVLAHQNDGYRIWSAPPAAR